MSYSELSNASLRLCPQEIRTSRTVMRGPHLEQIPVRQAWARANHDALGFVGWWRRTADAEVAGRSCANELASVAAGSELIFNVFACEAMHDASDYACGPYVGRIDLHSWDFDAPRCEIGYMADVRTQGKGLLREACAAVIELAFAMGVARVQAITDTRNLASIRFALGLGMQTEGILRSYERMDGVLCDQQLLSILNPNFC